MKKAHILCPELIPAIMTVIDHFYDLIYRQGMSSNTIYRIKHGKDITTKTINDLCEILDCSVSDIIEYIRPEK